MAEEEKPKQLVQMSTVLASGITAIVAALFTSRLGVAGTLIGTALTPMLMTIGVAVINAQIQKATEKISDLPSTVRGQLSTQRVRVPGTPSPEEPPQEEPPVTSKRRDRRTPGAIERLLSIPTYLREMAPSTRRRTLLTGTAAGLVAAIIGLAGVTGLEAASGDPLTCSVWNKCAEATVSGGETAETGTSLSRALGGSSGTETEDVPTGSEEQPAEVQQPEAPAAPESNGAPQNGQYEDGSQNAGGQSIPEEAPQELPADPAQQQGEPPAGQQPEVVPQDGAGQQPAVPEQQPADPSGQQQQQ